MKVCFIADNSTEMTGGAQSLLALMLSLKKYGVEPVLLGHKQSEQLLQAQKYGIKTRVIKTKIFIYPINTNKILTSIKYPIKRFYNFLNKSSIRKFFLEEQIEIIHMNSILASIECAVVAAEMNIPYVWHFREYLDQDHARYIKDFNFYNKYFQKAKYIIAISKDIQEYWSTKLGRDCNLVYNGFDINKYYIESSKKLDSQNVNCIMVGRLAEGKRQLDAIKAIEILNNKGIKNVHLNIIGYRDRFPYDNEIKNYISSHDLKSLVALSDYTYDLKSFYINSDIGLMCSTREAFGRVTIEYMLSGLLCIGSNTGGTVELINDGDTGLLFEMGSPEALAEKIEWVLNNRKESKKILLNGQKQAMEKFSIERTASEVNSIYQKILKK